MSFRTRFAPSPTGPLHLGHAYSAMLAHDMAQIAEGEFLLRIEDIDRSRARPEWEALIHRDLAWLGLSWPQPVMRQSERLPTYRAALERLWQAGLLYPCSCNRRDILEAVAAPHEGEPPMGPDGVVYPGTCRPETPPTGPLPAPGTALRLDMARAVKRVMDEKCKAAVTDAGRGDGTFPTFHETGAVPEGRTGVITLDQKALTGAVGDAVLARRDMGTSYHISVVVDDGAQDITHIVRGRDLFEATAIHVILQALLGLPTPVYHHHALIRDGQGKRLAKRHDSRAIRSYREIGATPDDVRRMVGLSPFPAP